MSITWKDLTDNDWEIIASVIMENKNKNERYNAYINSSVGKKFAMNKTKFIEGYEKPIRNYISALDSSTIDYSLLKYVVHTNLPAYSSLALYEEKIKELKSKKSFGKNETLVNVSIEKKNSNIGYYTLTCILGAICLLWFINSSNEFNSQFVHADILNIRLSPNGEIIDKLKKGDKVQIKSTDGDWVELTRGGWVSMNYLQKFPPKVMEAEGSKEEHIVNKKDILDEFLETNFAKENNVVYDRGWDLNTGGYTNNYDSKDTQFVGMSLNTKDGAVYEVSIQVLYPNDFQRPIELIKTFAPNINEVDAEKYLASNLKKSLNALSDAPVHTLDGGQLKAGNVSFSFGSQNINSYYAKFTLAEPIKNLPEMSNKLTRESEYYKSISDFLNQETIGNLKSNPVKAALNAKYPYLKNIDRSQSYTPVKQEDVYLFYKDIPEIIFWSKPGALSFGGSRVGILEANSPQLAVIIAHASLPGDRNYFYIYSSDELQGWVGRPYVKINKAGTEFYMANPITGDKFWSSNAIPIEQVSNLLTAYPQRFVPSYDDINWDSRIPVKFRREGYKMYVDALNQGYNEVERLTNAYKAYGY